MVNIFSQRQKNKNKNLERGPVVKKDEIFLIINEVFLKKNLKFLTNVSFQIIF
jgi:hypothetical protein